jgi:N-acetylglucosaminyldiphosphoundecaprenol N-acetyl-beta-D-mannosaminyltransferase
MRVDAIETDDVIRTILEWADELQSPEAEYSGTRQGRYVCAANVHMTMLAHDDAAFCDVLELADLVIADGVPMVWALRALGPGQRRRVRVTPDLLLALFAGAVSRSLKVGLYGGTPETLEAFLRGLAEHFPDLDVPFAWSPPFRPLTEGEDEEVVRRIRAAGVQLLLTGIGCPRQELWMARHTGADGPSALPCVMIGVGAAFDVLGGRTGNAPVWMRDAGLEWAYRLAAEPRRLWRRYLVQNPRFLALLAVQLLVSRARLQQP